MEVQAGQGPLAVVPADRATTPTISVVIPALNEAKNLPHVFGRLPKNIDEVILVDGRSVDDTVRVARQLRPDVRIVEQTRRGKGNALACGFAACRGDIIVMIDAGAAAATSPARSPGRWPAPRPHPPPPATSSDYPSGSV